MKIISLFNFDFAVVTQNTGKYFYNLIIQNFYKKNSSAVHGGSSEFLLCEQYSKIYIASMKNREIFIVKEK